MKLIYVNPIGKNYNDNYIYEFFFTEKDEITYNEEWYENNPLFISKELMLPKIENYSEIKRLVTDIPFSCAQQNSCFPFIYCIDGCISVCYENISEYENYPEPYRIVFQFGEDIDSVREKLNGRDNYFEGEKNSEKI